MSCPSKERELVFPLQLGLIFYFLIFVIFMLFYLFNRFSECFMDPKINRNARNLTRISRLRKTKTKNKQRPSIYIF
jgi:hypothetical protein